jgi:hypothetical protein
MMYLTGWSSSRPVASSSLRLVGILFACKVEVPLLMLVVEGEEELLAVVVPERSSSLLLWSALLSLSKNDLVKRLRTKDSAGGSASLALSAGGGSLWSMERVIRMGDDSSVSMGLVCGAGSTSASMVVGGGGGELGGAAAIKASTGPAA